MTAGCAPAPPETLVWSYGGGIQTACIAVLIKEGILPRPDVSVIADTSREKGTTWEYLDNIIRPYLAPLGVEIEVMPHEVSRKDLYDESGLTLIPAYTETARIGAFCSGEWKRDAIERWLRSKGVRRCTMWIGYSLDELRRVPRKDHRGWCKQEYPLIDKMINRTMCKGIILKAGLPLPIKSRCWCCPHQNDEEWAQIKASPEEWAKAVRLENEINAGDPLKERLYLYKNRVPLPLAEFKPGPAEPTLVCEGESCWT